MTDGRLAGVVRETLLTNIPAVDVSGVVREVLLSTPTAATLTGVVREVLMVSPLPLSTWQTFVTVNSS